MSLILDGTNGLSDVDGTAGTPAIRGSDANTGVFFGTDIVGVSTGGSERMRVDASGNVGIGTSSPIFAAGQTNLEISGSSGRGNVNLNTTEADGADVTVGSVAFRGGPSTSGAAEKRVALITGATEGATANNRGGSIRFNTKVNNGDLAERMRIDSSGNLLVGKTAATGTTQGIFLQADGVYGFTKNETGTGPLGYFVNANGTVSSGYRFASFRVTGSFTEVGTITTNGTSTTAYNTSSDYRLKHDIAPMTGALAKVALLKPVTYKWNADDSADEGFIAHELQEVCPSAVTGEKDAVDAEGNPQYQGIDTSFLVATLTAAIQEQQAIIESLTARVVALEQA